MWSLGYATLWYDEIVTRWLAVLPFGRMLDATAGDVHPPLWYILEWLIAKVSISEFAIRLPSAIFSIAGLVVLIQLGRRFKLGDSAILAALAIMALSPFELYFAQEARMYALLQLEIMVGLVAVLDRRWWLLSVCSLGMIYTHNYGLVYCAMLFVIAFVREMLLVAPYSPMDSATWISDPQFLRIFLAGLAPLILYLPWAPVLLSQFGNMDKWWQQPTTIGGFLQPTEVFMWNNALLGLFQSLGQIVAYGLVLWALVRAVIALVKERNLNPLGLAAFYFAPMLFSVVSEQFSHPTFLYRTFIGSAPALFLLLGWTLTEGVDRIQRGVELAVLAPLAFIAVVMFYPTSWLKSAVVALDERIAFKYGDVVYHMNSGSVVDFYYRYPDKPSMWRFVCPSMEGDIGTLSHRTMEAMGMVEVPLEKLKFDRAWLVYSSGPTLGVMEDATAAAYVEKYNGQIVDTVSFNRTHMYDGYLWLLQP